MFLPVIEKVKIKIKNPTQTLWEPLFFGKATGFSTNQNQKSSTQTMNARKGVYVVCSF